MKIFTIGHSTRSLEQFIALLKTFGIKEVADVRSIARSRRNPQFNADTLPSDLQRNAIDYIHLPRLGGLRHPKAASENTAWRNSSFRGFADYMQTDSFREALEELIARAKRKRVAIMCAEAVPWRCHRSLIADALAIRGIEVDHIMGGHSAQPHQITAFSRVRGENITYPQPAE